ncbi:hypothetical protein OCGS_2233 [Oceaniovalibus guishaninsula JLT2003]|uniref:DUF6456 domain-containing protein n=1 Tax=Oceaniovalibus guishaninsula JLT2003 TaxID=1231392 RepID=K2GL54_9RHOB|nr:DUF6456 domain-containing protein [Oceaniovalibus guishaninsula]EKE43501.1 hypothetical protein OCGS_2233 [Oceaniovalibus guishaninsula JLT2003]
MKAMRNDLPGWVPEAVDAYLAHVVDGEPIRAVARRSGCHASTVLRRIRRCETRRDDPLIDAALNRLMQRPDGQIPFQTTNGVPHVTRQAPRDRFIPDDGEIAAEARRILARLVEPGACLALADGMETAVVVREMEDGETLRTGTVDRRIAEAMALNNWIGGGGAGRIMRYRIRPAGRVALKELLGNGRDEIAERGRARRPVQAESPLTVLSRRRARDGSPFLSRDLVRAGERLREDYELARLDSGHDPLDGTDADPSDTGPAGARARVAAALDALGPSLRNVVLRACCQLEGLQEIERELNFTARSAKVILRIGLEGLKEHYDAQGKYAPLIG